MHSLQARALLWLIGRESNSYSVSPGWAGGSRISTSAWASRKGSLRHRVKINEVIHSTPSCAANRYASKERRLWRRCRINEPLQSFGSLLGEQSVSRYAG